MNLNKLSYSLFLVFCIGLYSSFKEDTIIDLTASYEKKKIKNNFYKLQLKLNNLTHDTIYLQVPYYHLLDSTFSRNYFAKKSVARRKVLNYFTSCYSSDSGCVALNLGFIKIDPLDSVVIPFNLYTSRKHKMIYINFRYSKVKSTFVYPKKYYYSNIKDFLVEIKLKRE